MILRDCVLQHRLDDLKRILATGQENVNFVDSHGRTALWYTGVKYHFDYATALIEAKADVNKADYCGNSPLHQASGMGADKCVRLLIQNKANILAVDRNGYTPLHRVCEAGWPICAQILIAANGSQDLDVLSYGGFTPLACAITCNNYKVAKLFLYSGARMKHVTLRVEKKPFWMRRLVEKRQNTMLSILVMKGILKGRLGQCKDVAHLIALYAWSMRLCRV